MRQSNFTKEKGFSCIDLLRFLVTLAFNGKNLFRYLQLDEKSPSENRVNVFIIDDSLFSRSRSKAVELLARVKDHVENRYVRGFWMLTLGWFDGQRSMNQEALAS